MNSKIENEAIDLIVKEMARNIDATLMLDMLVESGWTNVELTALRKNIHYDSIIEWCESHVKNRWKHLDTRFIFERDQDAIIFMLKWT